jgi:predicted transcriptional regulator
MSTTTIRLSGDLKARVPVAAARAGLTAHGFILEAIAEKTLQTEMQADFDAQAEQREARIARTGMTVPWSEMRAYLEKRVKGLAAERPKPKKLELKPAQDSAHGAPPKPVRKRVA